MSSPEKAGTAPSVHEVVTPEGVPLHLFVAAAGDRVAALLLDLLLIALLLLVLVVPLALLAHAERLGSDLVAAAALLAVFLLRALYFPFFEIAWQGQTPGKRRLGIRAVDSRGGPLTAEAVIARNLTRELELFLPLIALFAPTSLFPGAPGYLALLPLGWLLVFGFLPLFNRDRLRIGDLVAGTIVIHAPKAVLLEDLTTRKGAPYAFTQAQIDAYGVYELQVLEDVLRGARTSGRDEAVRTVADRIKRKIGFEGAVEKDLAFLEAFYAALRERLEKRLLFGKRKRDKHDRS